AIYPPSAHHQGLVSEAHPVARNDHNRIATSWQEAEAKAKSVFADGNTRLIILRSTTVPLRAGEDSLNRLLKGRLAFTLPGHDPAIQLLSPHDLGRALRCVIENNGEGIYHIAPRQAIPLKKALRTANIRRVPVPRLLQSAALHMLEPAGNSFRHEQLEYIR